MAANGLRLPAVILVLVAGVAVYSLWPGKGGVPPAPSTEPGKAVSTPATRPAPVNPRVSNRLNPPEVPASAEAAQEEIEAAVVTYSPDALPTFERLLASNDPDVREAARDGLIRLGETGGAGLLRRATARLSDPDEIKRMQETADYLELPSALDGPLKRK